MRLLLAAAAVLSAVGCSQQRVAKVKKPKLPPVMQQQVLNAVNAGDGNVRVRRLRERIAAEPRNVAARLELAAEYGLMGYPDLEMEHYRIAVERFPESTVAAERLAKSLRKLGSPGEAADLMAGLVEQQSKPNVEMLSWAGILLDEAERLREGEGMHRRAILVTAKQDYLFNNLGYNLMLQKRFSEAADAFRQAIAINSASATARNNLGQALLELSAAQEPTDAMAQFHRASDLAIAHNNVGALLYARGDLPGARKELEIALEYRRDVPQILENLRLVSVADGKPIGMPSAHATVWQKVGQRFKVAFGAPDVKQNKGSAEATR